MKGKILVILGHFTDKSFCGALAEAYAQGSRGSSFGLGGIKL